MNHSNDCKSKWRFKPLWVAMAFVLISGLIISCDDEQGVNQNDLAPDNLRYANVTAVHEGKSMKSARPVVFSTTKAIYEIVGGSAEENGVFEEDQFSIVDTTGIVSLRDGNILLTGKYFLDIKVSNTGGEAVFPKAFSVTILPSAVEGLVYAPFAQVLVRGKADSKTTAPTFKGTKPATFAFKEVDDFQINAETGEISLDPESEIEPGNYTLSVEVQNAAETTLFEDVIQITVETKPYALSYTPQEYLDVQQGQSKVSSAAVASGTAPMTYSLKDQPEGFSIDANTGVISLAEGNTLDIGTYSLTVVAANEHGSAEFADVVSFEIVPVKLVLPYDLQYSNANYSPLKGYGFTSVQPTVSGSTPITFALANDFGAFTIDSNTGVITLAEGNTLEAGTYNLSVAATNDKGEASFDNVVEVIVREAVAEQVFEDGWDNIMPAAGDVSLGNMVTFSSIGDPVQASNKKWNRGWGNWTVKDQDGVAQRGAIMIPQKVENDDWLIAEGVNLSDYVMSKLYFAGYSKYGIDASTLKLLVSEDYIDNPDSANWQELSFDQLPTTEPSQDRVVDLSQFDGKRVTIALRHESRVADGVTADKLTRTHLILHFEVKAVHK